MDLVERLRAAGCVFAEDEAALLRAAPGDLETMVARRVSGVPLEHVLGWADFAGQRILVDDGVFVPRPRTEALVELAVARGRRGGTVLDICCGSGAVGLAIARGLDGEVWASDIDPATVACARKNLPAGRVFHGDLFEALPAGLLGDVIVVIAPYVPSGDIRLLPHEARDFEPRAALDGGEDGLDVLRCAVAGAPARLRPGGLVLTETSRAQAAVAAGLLAAAGLVPETHGTVLLGRYG